MLVLLDQGFDANAFLAEVAGTGAMLLARAKATRNPAVIAHLPDGSYQARLDDLDVRMIDAGVAMTGADGTRVADTYRLITTLSDYRAFPATDLVRLYHERWEIESAFLALRHTLLDGRVLRSGDRPRGQAKREFDQPGRGLCGVDRLEADPGEDGNERHLGHLFAHDQERVVELGGA